MNSEKVKRFKSKTSYYWMFGFYLFVFVIVSVCLSDFFMKSEQEYVSHIINRKLIGSGRHVGNIAIQKFIVGNFGAKGMLTFFLLVGVLYFNELCETIKEYRRMLFREKQIREGLRAPDDYVDDYVKVPLWRKIANLFVRSRKKKYPSKRAMRDSLKKNKYYKE